MPDTLVNADVRALLRFRDELELGDGLFHEITGIEASQLFSYRRGKLTERPRIALAALARVERCRAALKLAMELTGDEEKSLDWLYAESSSFSGKSPIDLTINEAGLKFLNAYIEKLRAAVGSIAPVEQSHPPALPAQPVSPAAGTPDDDAPLAAPDTLAKKE